jgi:1-phosphofructokinase family hexose kinase
VSADRVLVVSTNPAVDVEWRVDRLLAEEKNEVLMERRWPGGKGINVARWLRALGDEPELVLPIGGETGTELVRGLRQEKIEHHAVRITGANRANVVVTTKAQGQFRLNPTWPVLQPMEVWGLADAVRRRLKRCSRLVLSGALVRGAPPDLYAQWVQEGREAGCRVFLDCDGDAFRLAIKARPFLVKPNLHELEQWAGDALPDFTRREAAARALAAVTGGWVLVSLGAEGAFLVGEDNRSFWHRSALKVPVRNTVGAGDAMLAGVVRACGLGDGPGKWLRSGIETSARCVRREAGDVTF